MAEPPRDDFKEEARASELIDLAQLGAADPERGVAMRDSAVPTVNADPDSDFDPGDGGYADPEDDDYEPGWLGTVLRWPIRIVAVIVIAPFQVAWESVKAIGRVGWRGLSRVGRGIRRAASVLGRPFRAVGRAIGWAATRFLWWPLRWIGRGTGEVLALIGRGAEAVYRLILTPIGHGIAATARAVGAGINAVGRGISFVITWLYFTVLAPIGHGIAAIARGVRDGLGWVGRQIYRWILHPIGVAARAVGRVLVRVLYYLAQPFVLLGRGLWYLLKVFWRWIVGLFHVIGQAFGFAARVGAAVGRGVVWLWTHSVWVPIRFAGRGFWEAAKWVGRGLRTAAQPVVRGLRAVRTWYRHEITEPVRAALRAARRDIRRALFGRRRS
ncbi:MAG: hypothetical protein HOW97_33275 [Catenulispora sp.]|nr:hypothetical protein [Catenulispora sp.]